MIEGAFRVLDDFEAVDASIDAMKALELKPEEERALATAALALCYGERSEGQPPAPVTAEQLIEARRPEYLGHSLRTTFQRVQEKALRGGQPGRSTQGRRIRTREHRPRREPEPGAVDAGRGDAEVQAVSVLYAARRTWLAVFRNERCRFTTCSWGRRLAALIALGAILKIMM